MFSAYECLIFCIKTVSSSIIRECASAQDIDVLPCVHFVFVMSNNRLLMLTRWKGMLLPKRPEVVAQCAKTD